MYTTLIGLMFAANITVIYWLKSMVFNTR